MGMELFGFAGVITVELDDEAVGCGGGNSSWNRSADYLLHNYDFRGVVANDFWFLSWG